MDKINNSLLNKNSYLIKLINSISVFMKANHSKFKSDISKITTFKLFNQKIKSKVKNNMTLEFKNPDL
jgi:hypothetical protein